MGDIVCAYCPLTGDTRHDGKVALARALKRMIDEGFRFDNCGRFYSPRRVRRFKQGKQIRFFRKGLAA